MEETMQTFDIRKFMKLFPGVYDAQLGNDFFIADIRHLTSMDALRYPCRFEGYVAIFCLQGDLDLDINLHTFHLQENSLLVCIPGHIVRVARLGEGAEPHFIVVAMSQEFMSGIHIDFNRLFNEGITLLDNPGVTLDGEELKICRNYLSLAIEVLGLDFPMRKEALSSLISSCFYVLGSVISRKLSEARKSSPKAPSMRARMVFEQFIHLVTEHHSSQRNMAFYAERLCLTPKYLSKLVKQVSGRSAPDWIDSFVILEAKNMLKYSDATIKEIVFHLHFPNQSVFYKFFKAHTGMTPSEYRNS